MFTASIVTARLSGRRRAPRHVRHGTSRMYCSSRSRWLSESVSSYRRSTAGTTPSYVVQYERVRPYRFRYRTWISWSEPDSTISRAFFGSFFHGVLVEKPWASATDSSTLYQYSRRVPAHGAMAPSSMESSGSGTTSSESTSKRVPRPSHVGHAP